MAHRITGEAGREAAPAACEETGPGTAGPDGRPRVTPDGVRRAPRPGREGPR